MESPHWLKKRIVNLDRYNKISKLLKSENIQTVCHSARCPNIYECFGHSRVTFMILGHECTRRCSFCSVKKGNIEAPHDEAENIIRVVKELGLKYVVITSPTRDDLTDGGAAYFASVTKALKSAIRGVKVEVLVSDFQGSLKSVGQVLQSGIDVFAHNLETVKSLYPRIRPQADYERSLCVLKQAKQMRADIITKSSIMLGFGEEVTEVKEALRDLRKAGVDGVCLGQYLKPAGDCIEVKEFVEPGQFNYFHDYAFSIGFKFAACGPWVRSSYKADELFEGLTRARV